MFSEELEKISWEETTKAIYSKTDADVRRALGKEHCDVNDFMALISPAATPYLEVMARLSQKYTMERFGKTISMFVPLYLTNSCTNSCVYCGFHISNPMTRTILTDEEIINEYKAIKRLAPFETLLLALAPEAIIIRTAWLYSPYGKNFVKTMLRLADTQPEIRVVCDQIGTPTYARDLARAVVKILCSHQWVPGIYHFTDEGAASWYDFAKAIFRIAGKKVNVVPIPTEDFPTPASRPAYSILDRSRIKATYGVEIPHWEEALADCMAQIENSNN